ncbi:Ig-like domain-containing protein [Clostridium sp. JNZ J1-5]
MNKKKLGKVTGVAAASFLIAGTTAFTAFAAMPSGTAVIGDKAYDLNYVNDPANEAEIVAAMQKANFKVYVKDFAGNWIVNETESALTDLSVIPAVEYKNAKGEVTKYDAKDGNVASDVVKVESVSAINAKQIQVTFNQPVEAVSAESSDNYFIQTNSDANPVDLTTKDATATVELSSDGKTVIITTTSDINTSLGGINVGTPFKFTVKNVKSANGSNVVEKTTVTLASKDEVAPTLTTVSAKAKTTTTSVTLKFSEPIDITGAIAYVGGESATIQNSSTPNEVTLTTSQALSADKSYELTLLNFKDYAGNFLQNNPTTTSFTVTPDAIAPVVQNITVVRDNLIEVTFDKAMDTTTFAGNSRVLDLNGVARDGGITATVKSNTSGKTIRLALAATVPFNDSNSFAGTLVLGDSIKDKSGNAIASTNRAITITKDTVRPTVLGTAYVAPGGQYSGTTYANGAIVVKFSEEVTAPGSDIKLITSNGVDTSASLSIAARAVNTNDAKEVIVPLTGGLTTGNYIVRVGNDVVQDLSTQLNKNVASTIAVKVDSSSDTTKPIVVSPATSHTAATTQSTGTTIVVNITDNVGLDLATVQNVSNYLLNGKPLPAGSYITIAHNGSSTDTAATDVSATINIPAMSITKDDTYTLNVNNVKDKAGNVALPKVDNAIVLVDDVSPELKTATISSNGLLVLGFTEDVSAVAAGTLNDLQFTINGTQVAVAKNTNIVAFADGTGTDTGKYVLTFKALVDNGADNNAGTTADNRLFLDVDGSGAYNAGDILIQTGTTKVVGAVDLDIANVSTLKVKVVDSTTVKDASSLTNPIKVGTTITVK